MNIKEITITQRASLNYQVSEHSITFELHDGDDERQCTQYISSLAMNDAINDVKALAKALPDAHPTQAKPQVSTTVNNNRQYTPQGQYRKAPYHQQNGQLSGPKPASEAQVAYFRQLAQQLGYDPNSYPKTSAECTQAIKSMKDELGLD